jgi:hypothetical protein
MLKRLSAVLCALASLGATAQATNKLHLERIDFKTTPTIKIYGTLLDGDGRVITGKQKDDVKLVLDAAEQGAASGLQTFADTKQAMFLVVVAQVNPAAKDIIEDEKRGISTLADALPPQSKMALIGYAGSDPKRLAEMGAPGDAQSAARTMTIDEEKVDPRMLGAVRTALDLLDAQPKGERKLLVIFSDGIDIDNDAHAFAAIGDRAAQGGVVIDTIGYNSFNDIARLRNVATLAKKSQGNDRQLKNAGDISGAFNNIADEIRGQYVATFDIPLAGGDPKEHTFQLIVSGGGTDSYSINTVSTKVPKAQHPPKKADSGSRWWLWLLLGLLGVGLIALIAWLIFRDKGEPVEEEAPVAAAPAPAPQPAGPMKTMALDVSSVGGTPMVGWIVGTSGKVADQTFKLKPSRTVIGTGADCDIKVEDQFMSSKHCEVRFENGMYKLVDLGSTNGIVVNDKKVSQHDLVDNDLIRCGRTEFKFKSVS